MAKTPEISFKLTKEKFVHLVKVLRYKMNEFVNTGIDDDPLEQYLFEHNYWLLKSWIVQADRQQQGSYTIKMDIMYAKAFIVYWKPVELPGYENMVIRGVLNELDRGLNNIEHKRKTKQL